jgi:hypothetical protein
MNQYKVTYAEALSEIRFNASLNGLTFKRKNTTLNGKHLWCFADRKSGVIVLDNQKFWTAYENKCAGYIDNYNAESGEFEY